MKAELKFNISPVGINNKLERNESLDDDIEELKVESHITFE
jgi:hypothetical protein